METLILWEVYLRFERGIKAIYRVNATSSEVARSKVMDYLTDREYEILSINEVPVVIDSVII